MDLLELKRVLRQLKKAANRITWRRFMARWTSWHGKALRAAAVALGDSFVGREKHNDGWIVLGADGDGPVPAVRVTSKKPLVWADFELPLRVQVLRRDIVDVDLLAELITRTASTTRRKNVAAGMSCPPPRADEQPRWR